MFLQNYWFMYSIRMGKKTLQIVNFFSMEVLLIPVPSLRVLTVRKFRKVFFPFRSMFKHLSLSHNIFHFFRQDINQKPNNSRRVLNRNFIVSFPFVRIPIVRKPQMKSSNFSFPDFENDVYPKLKAPFLLSDRKLSSSRCFLDGKVVLSCSVS